MKYSFGIHPSFERTKTLSEGILCESEIYPDVIVRTAELYSINETELDEISHLRSELEILESFGIATVNPQFFMSEDNNGLILGTVCKKLYGVSLDVLMDNGDLEAVDEYAKVSLKLINYFDSTLARKSIPLRDITLPCQFTYEDQQVILHDISMPSWPYLPPDNVRKEKIMTTTFDSVLNELSTICINVGKFAEQLPQNTIDEIVTSIEKTYSIIKQENSDLTSSNKWLCREYVVIIELAIASGGDKNILGLLEDVWALA